jgi:3-oxoacyl-[acyl-carrier-protein] synthase III
MATPRPPATVIAPPERRLPSRGLRAVYGDVFVESLVAEIPPETFTTEALEQRLRPLYRRLGFKPGWVQAVTGIESRRLWPEGVPHHLGAVSAARRALAEAGVEAGEVQVVVSCSVFKTRLEPSVACEVQGSLGIGRHCASFDVGNACLGFLTGMLQVANQIELGQIDVGLVVASEDAREILDATLAHLSSADADIHAFKNHLATLTLGSAASAAVLTSRRRSTGAHRFLGGTTLSAAHHHDLCVGDARGMVTDSVRLLREGVALAGQTWSEVRDVLGWEGPEVRTFALHQVGKAHHEAIVRNLGLSAELVPQIYPWMGNIGACGVPTTAALARDQGHYAAGDLVALMGIGSGINCAMLGVQW